MKLLIPGPVTTRPEIHAAMAQDYAPWDNDFRDRYARLPACLLRVANADPATFAALPLQGSGHFAVEAAIRSFVPPGGRLLVPIAGQYALRLVRLAEAAGRLVTRLEVPPNTRVAPEAVSAALAADPSISHLAIVYSETSSGIVHDVPSLCAAAGALGRRVLVDAVSAFGALPLDMAALPALDAAVFSVNKCLEAPPGMSFTLARVERLLAARGQAGSWSLDLADVYDNGLRGNWAVSRFTPPAQVVAACVVALELLEAEGGRAARLTRYTANGQALYDGALALGLTPYLPEALQGPIVMNIHAPDDPAWNLQTFVDALKRRGFLISNFHNTDRPSFRVGCIGAITPDDLRGAVAAMGTALDEMGVRTRRAALRQAA